MGGAEKVRISLLQPHQYKRNVSLVHTHLFKKRSVYEMNLSPCMLRFTSKTPANCFCLDLRAESPQQNTVIVRILGRKNVPSFRFSPNCPSFITSQNCSGGFPGTCQFFGGVGGGWRRDHNRPKYVYYFCLLDMFGFAPKCMGEGGGKVTQTILGRKYSGT